MKRIVPNHIVHYSRGEPFCSITSVSPNQVERVINGLNEKNAWGINRFSNSVYYKQRLEVEKAMRSKFIEKGGAPILSHPIYFFLGRNNRFEEHPLNIGYVIDLSDIDMSSISFSYGDTMLSFNEDNRNLSGEQYENSLCDKLFSFDELNDLFDDKLFPTQQTLHVEAHLWTQPPLDLVRKLVR